jgi:hypothetical protein
VVVAPKAILGISHVNARKSKRQSGGLLRAPPADIF